MLGGLLFGPLFAVVGYFVAFSLGKPILDDAKASRDWPTAAGVVTRSVAASRRSDGNTLYRPEIEYRYRVEGREFTGDSVFFGDGAWTSSSSAARKVTGRYPEGAEVAVYHEPGNPANAVLEPGAQWQSYFLYGLGLLFLVVGVLTFAGSLFYVLAAGALLGGLAAVWLAGSSRGRTGRKSLPPRLSLGDSPRPAPPRVKAERPGAERPNATQQDDDGFNIH